MPSCRKDGEIFLLHDDNPERTPATLGRGGRVELAGFIACGRWRLV